MWWSIASISPVQLFTVNARCRAPAPLSDSAGTWRLTYENELPSGIISLCCGLWTISVWRPMGKPALTKDIECFFLLFFFIPLFQWSNKRLAGLEGQGFVLIAISTCVLSLSHVKQWTFFFFLRQIRSKTEKLHRQRWALRQVYMMEASVNPFHLPFFVYSLSILCFFCVV